MSKPKRQRLLCFAVLLWGSFLNQVQGQHALVFYARKPALSPFSIGGHTFVSWVAEDSLHRFSEKTYGFYPARPFNFFTLWFNTRGKIVEGFEENFAQNRGVKDFTQPVPKAVFHQSMHHAVKWNDSRYHLFSRNCLAFVDDVAEQAGMKTPSTRRFLLLPKSPTRYLRQLVEMNRESDSRNYAN